MKPIFKLVSTNGVEADTVECIEAVLDKARRGEVIGIAMVTMYRQRQFSVRTCGELHRNPTFCRGAVAALDDELARRQWDPGS